ncbi:hypothetical protein [Rhodoblastus sp.]|uniref:hypothetical protein n=1 Tax=Rhodoblastus sp. TaxID=1962975 RepID=UPI003F94D51D
MVQRQQRTKPELEAICLLVLQGQFGPNHIGHVEIGPYSGPKGWTWQMVEAGPDGFKLYAKEAIDAVRIFQENFDLKTTSGRA